MTYYQVEVARLWADGTWDTEFVEVGTSQGMADAMHLAERTVLENAQGLVPLAHATTVLIEKKEKEA